MNVIQDIFVDSLNGFPVSQLPLFIFQLVVAGLLGFIIQFVLNKKSGEEPLKRGTFIAVSVAILSAIAKYSLPFAVLAAACILLLANNQKATGLQRFGLFLFVAVGIGCGVGSVVLTGVGAIALVVMIAFTPLKD